ncbi:ATPase domain protein, prokaryote domain protein [Candidatus Magnetomorum sp. HK-1]|nr:ATPase domain protein, prokaryote domain protein [Candidatus Magnetomorum sp. HK-1]
MLNHQKAIENFVPEEVYTDRQEHIEYFYNAALNAVSRRTMSTVLLGQRRMGKTEIFTRVVNQLFSVQNHQDDEAVIPIFFKFPEENITRYDFALRYVENFLRWFVAFRMKDLTLLRKPRDLHELIRHIEKKLELTPGLDIAIDTTKAIMNNGAVMPAQVAIMLPKDVAFAEDIAIAVFLDEFQNTRLPHLDFSIVGFFQEAVESPRCPHFVTGSAMSILSDEILGKGALYGRFKAKRIEAFTDYYGEELTLRAASYYRAVILPEMAPVISDRCGGNPFYITAVIRQAAEQNESIDSEKILNKILAVDISSGFIWMELSDQVNRWIQRINDYGITKWILYLAAIEEDNEIDLIRIQQELKTHESIEIPVSKIKEIMIKLARGDLIEYRMYGNWFCKINDPILNEFLKVWGEIDVLKQNREWIEEKTLEKFQTIEKRFHEYKGYLAEIYMIQILWASQRKIIPGKFFNHSNDVKIPNRFIYIDQRHRQGAGSNMEVDIYASAATEIWLAESKWWHRPVGEQAVEHLLKQADIVRERKGDKLKILRLWLFSYSGVTKNAEKLLKKHSILWSTKEDLNELLGYVHLRKLPELEKI